MDARKGGGVKRSPTLLFAAFFLLIWGLFHKGDLYAKFFSMCWAFFVLMGGLLNLRKIQLAPMSRPANHTVHPLQTRTVEGGLIFFVQCIYLFKCC